ncbi:MAG: nicotinate-nucleotide adenylyltransferase [Eubacteriales bacterium]|nr:nicotinate-nucleotide adenylyltransferase [Eubacteriales bacterium]
MRKIGILGGTFNPIHNGHLILAETARSFYGLEEVWLIPSGCSYMKELSCILPGRERLAMAALAVGDNPCFRVLDLEVKRQGNSYTCDTLEALHAEYPDCRFYYIVGADTLFHMESWYRPEAIFAGCVTVAAVRDCADEQLEEQARRLADKYSADIRFLPSLEIGISATEIRRRLREGMSVRYLVPEKVRIFLEENGCYREENVLPSDGKEIV